MSKTAVSGFVNQAIISVNSETPSEVVLDVVSYDPIAKRHDLYRSLEPMGGDPVGAGLLVKQGFNPKEQIFDNTVVPGNSYYYSPISLWTLGDFQAHMGNRHARFWESDTISKSIGDDADSGQEYVGVPGVSALLVPATPTDPVGHIRVCAYMKTRAAAGDFTMVYFLTDADNYFYIARSRASFRCIGKVDGGDEETFFSVGLANTNFRQTIDWVLAVLNPDGKMSLRSMQQRRASTGAIPSSLMNFTHVGWSGDGFTSVTGGAVSIFGNLTMGS